MSTTGTHTARADVTDQPLTGTHTSRCRSITRRCRPFPSPGRAAKARRRAIAVATGLIVLAAGCSVPTDEVVEPLEPIIVSVDEAAASPSGPGAVAPDDEVGAVIPATTPGSMEPSTGSRPSPSAPRTIPHRRAGSS